MKVGQKIAWGLLVLVGGYLLLPHFVGSIASVALSHFSHCTRMVPTCAAGMNDMTSGWQQQPALYAGLNDLVASVRGIAPNPEPLRLRHAELLVAQGKFQAAAALLEPLPLPTYVYSDEESVEVVPSRLFINGTPENALLAAYQQAANGDSAAAIAALRLAIATAPELLGEAEWSLYRELTGSATPESTLPPSPMVEYALAASGTWRGMDIIGVGLDSSHFTANGSGMIPLWLKVLSSTAPPDGIPLESGVWWLPYQATNLAPNPSFEWGSATIPNGVIPEGYFAYYSSAGEQGITFPATNQGHLLQIEGNGIQAVSSYPLAVSPDALYLMGATVESTGRFAMGRRCYGAEGSNRLNLWIHPIRDIDLRAEWNLLSPAQAVAHISRADPTQAAVTCQFILEAQGGSSTIDNVFLLKIE